MYAETKNSKDAISKIINKAKLAFKAREAAKKAKDLTRQKDKVDNYSLIGKLSSCTGRNYLLNDFFSTLRGFPLSGKIA